jgi:hypothetical protein
MNTKEIDAIRVKAPAPTGVEGWLLVLCLILVAVFPIASIYHILLHTIPNLAHSDSFSLTCLLSVYCLAFASLAVYSLIAGLKLWLIKPGAVSFVRRYLWTYLTTNIAYFVFWVIVTQPKHLQSFAEMGWYHIVGPILPFTLWSVYLEHSKRVRATYALGQS